MSALGRVKSLALLLEEAQNENVFYKDKMRVSIESGRAAILKSDYDERIHVTMSLSYEEAKFVLESLKKILE